jgi:hypothetical protein
MTLKSALYSTSSVLILSAGIFLTGCGDSSTSNTTESNTTKPAPGSTTDSSSATTKGLRLVFNGFSKSGTFYDANPMSLAGDLSAVEPANLYLESVFEKAVGTPKFPSTKPQKDYSRTLPKSGAKIQTGMTVLDPQDAMISSSATLKIVPDVENAVFLSVPAALPERPEAPFFAAGTRYTGVIIEAPNVVGHNHGAIVSIESGSSPIQFAAFAHHPDKTFSMRTYDKTSTVDKTGKRELLTQSTHPATIQSRFLVLSADGLANGNLALASIDRSSLSSFGVNTGKELLKNMTSLDSKKNVFPQLVKPDKEPIFNDGDHGVFCLGGNNTFASVDLKDQTFVYPISTAPKKTMINILNVSKDSGFITESGKHIEIDTLNGQGTLKLIAVIKGSVAADPVVHVKALNGINSVNVVIGVVDSAFVLPTSGMSLLSFDNTLGTPLTVNTLDAHMAGAFFDGESEVRNGKEIVLKSLTKKTTGLSGGIALRSLANHPQTQGLTSQAMNSLMAMLDPMASAQTTLGNTSASLSQHALGLQLNAPYSANQSIARLSSYVNVSASRSLDNTVASVNLNSKFSGLDVITSVYGLTGSNQNDMVFGSFVTASKSFDVNGVMLIPSVAVGYSMDALSDKTLSAQGINVNLFDVRMNSVFARFMTALHHNYDGLSATLAMGLEAHYAMFNNGRAFTNYDSVSLAGESGNGVYSIVEASFASNSTRLNITLSNFNHAQIQFGFND